MFGFIGFVIWLIGWILYLGMWAFGAFLVIGIIGLIFESPETAKRRTSEQKQQSDIGEWLTHGSLNTILKCPHCDDKGGVRTKSVNQRKGISGGRAAGAVLTGGISMLATGISRREKLTKAFCEKCRSTWMF